MREHKNEQKQICNRFIAERFTKFMVELHDWSINHDCEIGIATHGNAVVVTFTKNGERIRHSFTRSTLSVCDEMLVWAELESAFKALTKTKGE